MSDDRVPNESTPEGHEDIAEHFHQHPEQTEHRLRPGSHTAFGGVGAFLIPMEGGGRRIVCRACLLGS